MSKPWQLSKWEKRRKEFIKGKTCEWCGSEETLAIHHPQERNSLTDAKYESFEGTMVLCKRCHFVLHKGMHLCPKCKKKYVKNRRFELCFGCYSKTKEGKTRIAKRKKEEAKQRQWEKEMGLDAKGKTRMEYCGNCKHHIEDEGQELFCGLSPDVMCDHGLFEENGVRRFQIFFAAA